MLQHVNASTAAFHELHDILAPEQSDLRSLYNIKGDVLHQTRPFPAHSCAGRQTERTASDADTASALHAQASPWPRHVFSVDALYDHIPCQILSLATIDALTTSSASTPSAVRLTGRFCFVSAGANARNSTVRSACTIFHVARLPTRLQTCLVDYLCSCVLS